MQHSRVLNVTDYCVSVADSDKIGFDYDVVDVCAETTVGAIADIIGDNQREMAKLVTFAVSNNAKEFDELNCKMIAIEVHQYDTVEHMYITTQIYDRDGVLQFDICHL